jgi:integrase
MIGKRAKILAQAHVEDLLFFARHTRHPIRNQVIVLLSLKAGLRAAEIANLTWDMVVDPTGEIATTLELRDHVAKKGSGRVIPVHSDLREALMHVKSPSEFVELSTELAANRHRIGCSATRVVVARFAGRMQSRYAPLCTS